MHAWSSHKEGSAASYACEAAILGNGECCFIRICGAVMEGSAALYTYEAAILEVVLLDTRVATKWTMIGSAPSFTCETAMIGMGSDASYSM